MSELPNNDPFAEIKPGMSFTGVIDGSFPGGYLITVGVGNCPTLSGVAFTSDQPAPIERNINENVPIFPPRMDINIDEVPPGFEMEHELVSKYYNIGKFIPVKLNPVNPSTRVPINQAANSLDKGKRVSQEYYGNPKDFGIKRDPFLPRHFPSPALANLPTSDMIQSYMQTREGLFSLN
jgi:hypothetical protein